MNDQENIILTSINKMLNEEEIRITNIFQEFFDNYRKLLNAKIQIIFQGSIVENNFNLLFVFYLYPIFGRHYYALKEAKIIEEKENGYLKWKSTKISLSEYVKYLAIECIKEKVGLQKERINWQAFEILFQENNLKNSNNNSKDGNPSPHFKKILEIIKGLDAKLCIIKDEKPANAVTRRPLLKRA